MNERQTKFCQFYAKSGNAFQSYVDAGYNIKSEAGARASSSKLLTNPNIVVKLKELGEKSESKAIATISEVKEFWTKVMQSDEEETPHRIKAGELLVKVEGGFIDRVQTDIKQTVHYYSPEKNKDL